MCICQSQNVFFFSRSLGFLQGRKDSPLLFLHASFSSQILWSKTLGVTPPPHPHIFNYYSFTASSILPWNGSIHGAPILHRGSPAISWQFWRVVTLDNEFHSPLLQVFKFFDVFYNTRDFEPWKVSRRYFFKTINLLINFPKISLFSFQSAPPQ